MKNRKIKRKLLIFLLCGVFSACIGFFAVSAAESSAPRAAAGYSALFGNGANIGAVESYAADEGWLDRRDGVRIAANGVGSYFYRTDVIDLNDFTKEDSLLTFYVERSEQSYLTTMRVALIDANDSSNSIAVRFRYEPTASTFGYMVVEYGDYNLGINNQDGTGGVGKPRPYYGTLLTSVSFTGAENINPFNFSYDITENAVYTRTGGALVKVLDLDDEEALADYGTWGGFGSGHVYIRVEFETASRAAIVVQETAGITFSAAEEENFAPVNRDLLRFEFDGKITDGDDPSVFFEGAAGYSYPVPQPITRDPLYGTVSADMKLFYGEEENEEDITADISEGRIQTEREGRYRAEYTCADNYGNEIVKNCVFSVTASPEPITFSGLDDTEADILTRYALPEIMPSGGRGELHTSITAEYNGEPCEPDENGKIYLDKKGQLVITAAAEDALGYTAEESMTVNVISDVQAIFLEEAVPLSMYAGREYVLPDFTATDFSLDPYNAGYGMEKQISVNGVILGEDRTYTPSYDSVGKYLTVEYRAGVRSGSPVTQSYRVMVLPDNSGNNVPVSRLFLPENGSFGAAVFEYGTSFRFSGDASLYFANYLPEDSAVTIHFIETNFSRVNFILEDSLDGEERITVSFIPSGNGFSVSVNGGIERAVSAVSSTYALGSMQGREYRELYFETDRFLRAVTDDNGNTLAPIAAFENGDVFTGFSSGLVKLYMEFEGVTGSSVFALSSLSNQGLASAAYSRGDRQGAAIGLSGEILREYSRGDILALPAASAYDVVQGRPYAPTVTVTSPSGAKTELSAETGHNLPLNEYGVYEIVYAAIDYYGNEGTLRVSVTVKDTEAPVIMVRGEIPSEVSAGESITVPQFTAYDNVGVAGGYIFLEDAQTKKTLVGGGDSLDLAAGRYRLIYMVQDTSGNSAVRIFVFNVK